MHAQMRADHKWASACEILPNIFATLPYSRKKNVSAPLLIPHFYHHEFHQSVNLNCLEIINCTFCVLLHYSSPHNGGFSSQIWRKNVLRVLKGRESASFGYADKGRGKLAGGVGSNPFTALSQPSLSHNNIERVRKWLAGSCRYAVPTLHRHDSKCNLATSWSLKIVYMSSPHMWHRENRLVSRQRPKLCSE